MDYFIGFTFHYLFNDYDNSIMNNSYAVPFVFRNCSDIFRPNKDEKYANCSISADQVPCILLREVHRAKEFRTYFLAILPIVLSAVACVVNISYLLIQINFFNKAPSRFKKQQVFLISRTISILVANILLYVVIIVWKTSGFMYTSAMIFILVGSMNFLSVTGTYTCLTISLYSAVAHPLWYQTRFSLRYCYLLIVLIWLISIALSICVGLWGATLFYPDTAPIRCSFEKCQQPLAIVIVICLSMCYGTVLVLYCAILIKLRLMMRKSSLVMTRGKSISMKTLEKLSLNMSTFAVGNVPILIVCIVALVNLRNLSSLGEGDKSPCKTFLNSSLFVQVEILASVAAIVWIVGMIADPFINMMTAMDIRKQFQMQLRRFSTSIYGIFNRTRMARRSTQSTDLQVTSTFDANKPN